MATLHSAVALLPLLGLELPALVHGLHQAPHRGLVTLEAVLLLQLGGEQRTVAVTQAGRRST